MPSDEEVTLWLERAKAGDEEACGPIFDYFYESLIAQARKRIGHGGRAFGPEDAVQQALDTFFRHAEDTKYKEGANELTAKKRVKLQDRDDLRRLLGGMVRNKALQLLRKQKDLGESAVGEQGMAAAVGHCSDQLGVELREIIAAIMERLPHERRRRIFALMLEGYRPSDIAKQLDISKNIVEKDYYPIKKMLMEALQDDS